MQEKQLINKLKELRQIKPKEDWVVLTKNQIFKPNFVGQTNRQVKKERSLGLMGVLAALAYQRKFAYALASFLFIMLGMFGFAQYTVPGDALFSVKKLTEQSQTAFISQENQLKNNFETASRRLDDLTQVVKNNKMQNIAPAIKEFKDSISEATKSLVGVGSMDKKDSQSIKEIVLQIKKIKDNKKELHTLGLDLEDTQESEDLNNALAPLVKREIDDLENTTLAEDKKEIVKKVKDLYEEGKYSDALESILMINN